MKNWWKAITILSFSVLAMGAGLTVLNSQSRDSKVKTVDEYWTETGLGPETLEDLVNDDSCRSSQRYFLACANSLLSVTDRLGLTLSTTGGFEQNLSAEVDVTERLSLEPWRDFFTNHPEEARMFSFQNVWHKLNQEKISKVRQATMTGTALNGFLSVFRDPHTYLLPVAYYQNVVSQANPASSSLGVVIARGGKGYFLRKVVDHSPADRSGLRRGDSVFRVNGTEIENFTPQKLSELLRGSIGEVARFEIRRQGRAMTINVKRTADPIPSVSWHKLDGVRPVGVLSLNKFAKDSCQDVKKALLEMKEAHLRGLLFDLRDNSGGQMDEAACMISLFVDSELPAFRVKYLDPSHAPETFYGSEPKVWNEKVAILVNSGSASASEILAGSLHDYGRAILVGERTFGKGSFQEGEVWTRNHQIAFFQTKGLYFLPSGYSPQLHGLKPDVPVKFRDAMPLREEDQYVNPIKPPAASTTVALRSVDFNSCLNADENLPEDPQMSQARRALFCKPVAARAAVGGPRGSF